MPKYAILNTGGFPNAPAEFEVHGASCADIAKKDPHGSYHWYVEAATPEAAVAAEVEVYEEQDQGWTADHHRILPCARPQAKTRPASGPQFEWSCPICGATIGTDIRPSQTPTCSGAVGAGGKRTHKPTIMKPTSEGATTKMANAKTKPAKKQADQDCLCFAEPWTAPGDDKPTPHHYQPCGALTRGTFAPGHDAKLKGALIRAAEVDMSITVHLEDGKTRKVDPHEAAKERGWSQYTDAAKERGERKAHEKAQKDAEKAARAAEREKAAAAKKAAATAKKKAAAAEAEKKAAVAKKAAAKKAAAAKKKAAARSK